MGPEIESSYNPDDPAWSWPAWRVGMKRRDLASLHRTYNMVSVPLQDDKAFHRDVAELAALHDSQQDFLDALAARRDQRWQEVTTALRDIACILSATPALLFGSSNGSDEEWKDHVWSNAMAFLRSQSFESLALYWASYTQISSQEDEAGNTTAASSPASQSTAPTPVSTPDHSLLEDATASSSDEEQSASKHVMSPRPSRHARPSHRRLTARASEPDMSQGASAKKRRRDDETDHSDCDGNKRRKHRDANNHSCDKESEDSHEAARQNADGEKIFREHLSTVLPNDDTFETPQTAPAQRNNHRSERLRRSQKKDPTRIPLERCSGEVGPELRSRDALGSGRTRTLSGS